MGFVRVGLVVLLCLCARLASAQTFMPQPSQPDAGNVVVGTSEMTSFSADGNGWNQIDLVIASCSGGGGTFTFNPSTGVDKFETVTMTYMATARGTRSCTVNAVEVGSMDLIGTFTVTGTGVAPVVDVRAGGVTVTARDFGSVRSNDTAATSTSSVMFGVFNTTTDTGQTLTVQSITFSGTNGADFSVTGGSPFPLGLNPGGAQQWTVTFNPSGAGPRTATMNVATNDPITPNRTVALTGTGTTAVIAVSDVVFTSVTAGTTMPPTMNSVLSNTAVADVGVLTATTATLTSSSTWFSFGTGLGCTAGSTSCSLSNATAPASKNIPVRCAPPAGAMGTQIAMLTVVSDSDGGGDNTAMVSCTAVRPNIMVSTTAVDFAPQLVNTTSSSLPVTITNTGTSNLTFYFSEPSGDIAMFGESTMTGCGVNSINQCSVGAGASVTVNVTFSPTSMGAKSATLSIISNDPDPGDSTVNVALTGTGIAPVATANTLSLQFGNVNYQVASGAMTVTVTNTGTSNLTISNAALVGGMADYAVTSGTTGVQNTVLGMNATASWSLVCTPTAQGLRSGTFRVTSNSNNVANTNTDISLNCTGQRGFLVITTANYNFMGVREGDTRMQTFTLSNTGNVPVTNITATLDSKLLGFSISGVPTSLVAGGQTTVTVTFLPVNATYGCVVAAAGDCDIIFAGQWGSAAAPTSATLIVQGDGLASGYDTTPAMLDFAAVRFDQTSTMPVSVVNTAGSTMKITQLMITPGTAMTGEFAVTSCQRATTIIPCPLTALATDDVSSTGVNDTITINITCDPNNRAGMLDATLTVMSDLAVNPTRTVALKCNSTTAALAVNPSTMVLDFGATDLDAVPVSVTKTIVLTNTGNAPLNVGAAVKGGANLARYTFSATPATVVQPNQTFDIDVTYLPTVEKPPSTPDIASITFPLTGSLNGPSSLTVQISGYGADRHIQIGAAPTFPPTLRNPGDAAPVMPVTVTNTGDAPLSLTALMVSNEPVWSIVNPDPVTVPAHGTHDVMVRFAPTAVGLAPMGQLVIANNDNAVSMAEVTLSGLGIDRQVSMGPSVIDLGDTAVGVPVRLSDVGNGELLVVTSGDATNTFLIRDIAVEDGAPFAIVTTAGDPAADVELPPEGTQAFDVVLSPTSEGVFEASASLHLDMDPTPYAVITLRGRAARVQVHGGGGCSTTGHGGSAGLALVLGALLVGRRRRAATLAAVVSAGGVAQADDIDTETFRSTPATHAETFQLQAADVGKNGEWAALAQLTYATNPLAVEAIVDGMVVSESTPVATRAGFVLGGAYAFLGRYEAGLRVPLFQQTGGDSSMQGAYQVPDATGTALGDISVHGRARLLRASGATVGAALHMTLPTSSSGQFVGIDGPSARVLGLATYRPVDKLSLTANLGAVLRASTTYTNDAAVQIEQGSGLVWGAGASANVVGNLRLTAEAFGELGAIEALGGLRYQFGTSVVVGVAGGRGLTTSVGTPDLRTVFSFTYAPGQASSIRTPALADAAKTPAAPVDTDRDGVPDAKDGCPAQAEDKDTFQDDDGCAEDDADGDAIADLADKCPLKAEVINGVEDNDGCPDVADNTAIAVSGNLSATEAADETFKKGRELMAQRKFQQACVAFEQSQRLDPQAGTQFNLAGCYTEIGKLATAWTMFRELSRSDKNADRRAKSTAAATAIAARVPKLRVTLSVTPQGLQVFMNGANANALIGLETPVDFGSYEIVAGAPGFKAWRKTIEIKEEAKVTSIQIDLQPMPTK